MSSAIEHVATSDDPGVKLHPPLAGGGRYDAMTVRLGAARPVPAVGGMIRPEAVLAVTGAGTGVGR